MIETLARNWWMLVLRGVLAIVFGLVALLWPALTLFVLVIMFGVYAIVDGVVAVMAAGLSHTKDSPRWWVFLLEGLVSIGAGVAALLLPRLAALTLVLLIAAWAVVTGILEIAAAIRLRREINNEWLLGLGGLLSVILGIVLFVQPAAGAIAVIWTLAVYSQIFGILLIALGIRLKTRHLPRNPEARLV
jgi:uncharacterized membrane protein HdeD (DUF308 family)